MTGHGHPDTERDAARSDLLAGLSVEIDQALRNEVEPALLAETFLIASMALGRQAYGEAGWARIVATLAPRTDGEFDDH